MLENCEDLKKILWKMEGEGLVKAVPKEGKVAFDLTDEARREFARSLAVLTDQTKGEDMERVLFAAAGRTIEKNVSGILTEEELADRMYAVAGLIRAKGAWGEIKDRLRARERGGEVESESG